MKKVLKTRLIVFLAVFILCLVVFGFNSSKIKAGNIDDLTNGEPIYVEASKNDSSGEMLEKIAKNHDLQKNLASLAHKLGYGWCGGNNGIIGEDYNVHNNGDHIIITSNKRNGKVKGDDPLRIKLSNLRMRMDPEKINYGKPRLEELNSPKYISTGKFVNDSDEKVDISSSVTKEKWLQNRHEASYKFTESLKLTQSLKFGVPLIGEEGASMEFGFTAEQGWSNADIKTDKTAFTDTVKATLNPNSQKLVQAITTPTKYSVDYDADAQMIFDVNFEGFFRWGGNARNYHPDDRPHDNFTFGGDSLGYVQGITKMYTSTQEEPYWDMNWFKSEYGEESEEIIRKACRPVIVNLNGTFEHIDGTHVDVKVNKETPIKVDGIEILEGTDNVNNLDETNNDNEMNNPDDSKNEWMIEKQYKKEDVVFYKGVKYICLLDNFSSQSAPPHYAHTLWKAAKK